MIVARSIKKVREILNKVREKNKLIGFVPTMGALHLGHLSLVKRAQKECDFVVVSIFVNPTQFGPGEDFKRYPRCFGRDRNLLKREGVDLVFYPTPKMMYPKDFSTYVEELSLSKYLCGRLRPSHFRGVCTVVAKLFNIIGPCISYFGQKDYQQAQIIKRMVRDLNFPTKIKVLPIVREKDGLAMSSRNWYLNEEERRQARCLFHSLILAKRLIKGGEKNAKRIKKEMRILIKKEAPTSSIDYVSIADPHSLEEIEVIKGKVLVALAVRIGKARLIDNMIVG
jgi:pantoate--beta-alanine ligase